MVKLIVGGNGYHELEWEFEDIDRHISGIMEEEYPEEFTELLDEIYGTLKIGPFEYLPSKVLACTDPINLKEIYSEWEDNKITELKEEQENTSN